MNTFIKKFNQLDQKTKGLILVIGGNAIVSLDSLMVRMAGVSSWDTNFWFGVYSFIVLGLYALFTTKDVIKVIRETKYRLLISGLLMSGSVIFFISSIKLTHVANAAVIMSSAPIFGALFSWILLKEKTSKQTWIAMIFTISGILLVVSGSVGDGHIVGDAFALLSTAFVSLNFTLWRKYPSTNRMMSMAVGGFLIALISIWFATPFSLQPVNYAYLTIMGVVTAPWGRLASAVATKYLPVAEISMYRPLNTVLAPMWVWIVLGEKPVSSTFLGGAVIIVTLMVHTYVSNKQK